MQIINEDVSQKVSDVISTSTMPLSQAKQIYTDYKNKELAMPYEIPEEHKTERVVLGTLQRFGQSMEVLPEGIGILGGEIMMLDGKILQNTPFKDVAQANMKLGEKMIMGANSSLEAKRKRQAQELLPMTEEELSSPLSKSISTVTDYGSQILLALATGGTISLATMGARMAGETAVQGLEQYKIEHPEDKELTGFLTTGNLSKEVLLNAGKTAINLYVEKAIGVPKQVSQFKKALKTPAIGAMGVLKAAGKGYAMGFGEEWATETIQGITDTTFDAFLGRYKDMPELAKAYNEAVVDAVYAGIFGGGFGASGHVIARGQAIGQVKEMMSNVVPAQDLEMVATAIVDNHIASTKQMIGTQIQLSTELRDKHGEIYNALNVAAKQAMMESGVANTMTEDEIAQHAVELSTLFADQVLAEANKRNVPIFDVINSKDIVYDTKTKELRLAPKKVVEAVRKIKEKKPTSLIQFIKNNGGIQDEHGELKALDALRQRPGLVSKKGMTLDEARRMAEEAGYFGTNAKNEGMTSTADLLDLIDKELRGQKVYTEEGQSTIDRIKEAETYDNSEEEDYYERNLLAKGVSEEELSQMNFEEKKQAYEMSKETSDDGSYIGEDGLLHAADGSVLFQWEDIGNKTKYTKSEYDLKKLMKTFPPRGELRLMFDKEKGYWFAADSMELIHSDILPQAFKMGLYPDFRTEYDARQYFDDKTYADDGSLVRFIAFGYENNNYMDRIDQMADDYSRAYIIDNGNGNGVILFARYESDLDDANISYLGENAKLYDVVNKRFLENGVLNQEENYDIKKVSDDTSNIEKFREKNEEYNQKAKEYFGKAYKMAEAGYILTDGDLLDFSGKKFGGPEGQRTMDHRQISEAFEDSSEPVSMEDFINSGNIRYMPEGDKILMANYPTPKQFDMIRRALGLARGTFTVELMSDAQKWGMNRNDFYGEYEYGTPFTKVKRDIDAFYKGAGVRPEMEFYQVKGLPREKATPKGTFDAKSKVIQLFEKADASTLDHELAHFWLDNMWTYANSGAASEQYMAQFNAVKDYLGVRPDQRYLTRSQHEKFASAYEKYIYRGDIPNSIMGNVFDNYERFIRNVYNSIQDIKAEGRKKVRLTPEIIKFFDSMIKGGIDTTAATETIASEVRNEEAQKADDVTMKESKEVVANMPEREVQPEIKPVETEGKAKESRLYERMKGIVGEEGKLEYNVVEIKEQREKARKLWNENPEKARAILKGTEQAEDILRQALYTEQQRLALQNGDTNTFLTSLRKQSAEATRIGQELSALRGVVEDITDPAYWIRSAETEALKNLAKKQTKNLENAMGNSPLMELTARLDADIKALQKDVASKATDEEKTKAFKEGVKAIAEKYQGLEQPDLVLNQVDWSNEELADDYIETKVKEKLGIALPKETAKAFIQTARELDTLSRQRDEMGNPVDAFFAKKDELERMRNSHTPTARTKVLISTIGRANMLTAPATSVLNVVSNSLNYGAENVVRKVGNILEGKTNDNIVSKDLKDKYRAKAWKVFWETGYDMSFMTSLLDERLYKGESISHSEGDGAIRAVGRWAEKYVFSRLISTPDIYIKSVLGFTDYVGNEATDIAYKEGLTGEQAKARADELFKDAIKIEPETEQGKQIRAKAQTDALILTFQQDTKFARMLLDVRNAINKGTGDIGIGDILSPFIKTPANIISMGFDAAVGPFASPVNLIGALNDIKAKNYRSARVLQAARQTTTAALAYTVIALLASMLIDDDDYIPDYAQLTQKERAAVRAKGGSFGSIKVGGEYISTDFFGPFEMPLVTFLNTRRTGNIIKGIAGGVASKAIDAPVLKDILGSSEAIKEMATSKDDIVSAIGENMANAAITRLTPNALNTMAKIIDGKERKTNTVAEKIAARIPFVRNQLQERLSVATGEAQEIQALNMLLFGARGKYEEKAPLAQEISRLAGAGEAVNIVDPTRSGVLAKLSDADKSAIQDMFAREFADKASKEIARASYRNKSDEDKKDALDKIRKDVLSDIKRKYRKQIKVLQKAKK